MYGEYIIEVKNTNYVHFDIQSYPLDKLQITIDLAAILFMLIRWANVWLDSACFNYPKKVCSQFLKVTFLKNLTSLSKVQPIPYAFYDQNDWHFNSNFSVSASRTVGREFASRPGHTKDHHKNGTNCLPA